MKKLLFTIVAVMLAFTGLFAQTTFLVDGTVRDSATNQPVENLQVYIYNDTSSFYNMELTDSNGYFSHLMTFPVNPNFIVTFIGFFDCHHHWHFFYVTGGGGITFNPTICAASTFLCQANFYSIPDSSNSPNGPFGYNFTNTSIGNPTSSLWNFGDGTASSDPNPYHEYSLPGYYSVCLTTISANGCTDTFCDTIAVGYNVYNCSNFFDAHPMQGVTFFASFVQGPGQNITYLWNFGDSTTSTLMCPNHSYNQSGTYVVTLTTTDIFGCSYVSHQTITITGSSLCTANYSFSSDPINNLNYHFFDTSYGNVTSWLWNFGDSTTSTLQNPDHTYQQPGTYLVCLYINNPQTGCTSSYCDSITIVNIPDTCSNYFYYGTQLLYASFYGYAISGTPPYTYSWSFGDGGVSSMQNPSHAYNSTGQYTVSFTTTDASGCTFTSSQLVYISSSSPMTIWGQVTANNLPVDYGSIYLYGINPSGGSWYIMDTTSIDSVGYYWFSNVYQGVYAIMAELSPNSSQFGNFMPTYYGNTIFWSNAIQITLGQPINPYNIELQAGIPPFFGPGNISGTITSGNKLFGSGTPLANIEIMLLDMTNNPLILDYSDASGNFNFNNLPYGTYKVYAEVGGINTNPAVITLNPTFPNSNNVSLVMTPSGISGIAENHQDNRLTMNNLFPNPASDNLTLELSTNKSGSVSTIISDILGNEVISNSTMLSAGINKLNINTTELVPGSYMLQCALTDGSRIMRKIAIIR